MTAERWMGQHLRQQDALVEFETLFFLQRSRTLCSKFAGVGREAWHELGGALDQHLDAKGGGPIGGQRVVERFDWVPRRRSRTLRHSRWIVSLACAWSVRAA